MFEDTLNQRFAGLQAELNRNLYRRYTLQRDLARIEEDVSRIEAALAEVERIRSEWVAAQAEVAQDTKEK
uniref:Uncharacterized protein n=1 Tax=viral metagenome TaxID=1070528 RepID=A0A6M3LXW6_9ZZZZ